MTTTRPRRARAGLALALACTSAAACEQEEHERWIGPHLEYVWDRVFEPCAGTFHSMDGFIPFAAEQLDVDVDALGDLTYLWLTRDEIREIPGIVHGGAAIGRHVFMPAPAVRHELVHLLESTRLTFGGPRFLTEGIAVALEERLTDGPRYFRSDPRPYLTQGYLEGFDFYEPAGAFVAYLLSMYGPGPLFELYERLTLGAADGVFAAVFADVYGRDLDAEVEAYLAAETCPEGASTIPIPYECVAPTIPWERPHRWSYARRLTCDDDDVVGEPGSMFTAVTLDIPVDGDYEITAAGDRVHGTLIPCGGCPWLAENAFVRPRRLHLERGRHALRLWGFDGALTAVSIRLVAEDGPDEDDDSADTAGIDVGAGAG